MMPGPMFQRRNDAALDAGSPTVVVAMSRSVAITRLSPSKGRGWGLDQTGSTLGWDRRWQDQPAGGRRTWSMTWMTPFEVITSGVTTLALSFR
jgi:hypothetical protein